MLEIQKHNIASEVKILSGDIEQTKKELEEDAYPDSIFRKKGRKPLLIIHFIDLFKDRESPRFSNDLDKSSERQINFKSNEIVTHGKLSAALCAAVPAPASTRADK